MEERRVALVSGANRGIGREVVSQLAAKGMAVALGARDLRAGEEAATRLQRRRLDVRPYQLDVTDPISVEAVAQRLEGDFGRLDVLVNNAGIYPEGDAATMDMVVAERCWQTNALGAWRLAVATIPLMRRHRWGRIVNVSSEAGSLASMGTFMAAYNVSKAALNAVTRVLAADLRGSGILVNSVCPGWVATAMGGRGAPRSPEEGAASVLWGVMLPDDGPTGGFFRDGRPLRW
jgi:NAD(P)-dependent dehydrogenase (short-subunit alcohol dehydrogenase family)